MKLKKYDQFINESGKPKMSKDELKKRISEEAPKMFIDIKKQGGDMSLSDCKKELEKTFRDEFIIESFVNKEWDDLYEEAQKEPYKSKIKKALVKVFKDSHVMGLVGENFYDSDGSNGSINFSFLNHFITDIGYKCFADKGEEIFENIDELKKHILYSYASSEKNSRENVYNEYKNRIYDPTDEFSW